MQGLLNYNMKGSCPDFRTCPPFRTRMNLPESAFKEAVSNAAREETLAGQKFNRLALARLILFVAALVLGWLGIQYVSSYFIGALLAFVVFLMLMRRQQQHKRQRDFHKNIQLVNQDELNRLQMKFTGENTGQQYSDNNHPYLSDLDIMGKHSVFNLLNRTQTATGSHRLAQWLSKPADIGVILERQAASEEFSREMAWRQSWQATAMLYKDATQQIDALKEWAAKPLDPSLSAILKYRWWSVAALLLIAGWIAGFVPFWIVLLNIAAQSIFLKRFNQTVQEITDQTYKLGNTIQAYSALFGCAENAPFESKWWKQLPDISDKRISHALGSLASQFSLLDFRMNPYFLICIGLPTLWDLHCLARLEKWKQTHGSGLDNWLNTLSEIEAMNSLAGFRFANPEYTLPEPVWNEGIQIEALSCGHPLIPAHQRVVNHFSMQGMGQTCLITGSNMSGKSTFLRTIGVNLVLAQTGAMVCAQRFIFSPALVFTSMRTQDSLEENTSSFYAELKRLKQLIELAGQAKGIPVFYLLDEILKGTNSADRHLGAQALIRQLHPLEASGMVSTHDIELGEWGTSIPYVTNYHFSSDVAEGRLLFDYTIKPGICQSFNASELMRMMGIKMDDKK